MSDPFIGEIRIVGFNFAPQGWAFCQGQLLSIAQYSALFSLLGTTYGGDGQVTFALPDLRGRLPMGMGNGPGLTPRTQGEESGAEKVTLSSSNLPAHTHPLFGTTANGGVDTPTNELLGAGTSIYGTGPLTPMSPSAIGPNMGGGLPVPTLPPYLVLNFIIALVGIYPSRT